MTVPTTLSIAPLYTSLPSSTPVHPLGTSYATGTAPLHNVPSNFPQPVLAALAPPLNLLSLWYGALDWSRPKTLSNALLKRAGELCLRKLETGGEPALWRGGMLIDTPGEWADKGHRETVSQVVRDFEGVTRSFQQLLRYNLISSSQSMLLL